MNGSPGTTTTSRPRYTLPKPLPTGQAALTLAPLELLDRLAALIPPPRRHRHHYHGVFAPHAALRARAPPELKAERVGTPGFAFDQSPLWDPTTPAPDPGLHFDQSRD